MFYKERCTTLRNQNEATYLPASIVSLFLAGNIDKMASHSLICDGVVGVRMELTIIDSLRDELADLRWHSVCNLIKLS